MLKPETLLLLLRIGSPSDLQSTLFHAGTIALLARRIWAAPIDPRVLGAVDQRFCPPASQTYSHWSSGLRQAQDDLIVIHLFTTLGVRGCAEPRATSSSVPAWRPAKPALLFCGV